MSEQVKKVDNTTIRKLDHLSENLEDVFYDADKLKDELGETPNETLEDLRSDVKTAMDVIDDIAESDEANNFAASTWTTTSSRPASGGDATATKRTGRCPTILSRGSTYATFECRAAW
jgi:hypothetical protein